VSTDTQSTQSAQSAAALERYAVRLRRARIWYAAGLAVLIVAASAITAVVWLHGEISHTTLHTSAAPADVPLATPSAAPVKAWSTTDTAAIGAPYSGGTVITHDEHTVRGRNGLTGAQTWSYTRTDRVVCAAVQSGGVTVAVYRVNGNCDELTALASDTGTRKWTRTLDLDTHQLNGTPAIQVTTSTITLTTPQVIYAIDLNSGYNDWLFAEQGCTIASSVLGSSGALISQTCVNHSCASVKAQYCGNGRQLLLRDASAGENTDTSANNGNPDQVIWTLKNVDYVPATAGAVVTALNPGKTALTVFDPKTGKVKTTLGLTPATPVQHSGSTVPVSHVDAFDAELLWIGGTTYSLPIPGTAIAWSAATLRPPTAIGTDGGLAPTLSVSLLSAPTTTGIDRLDPATGKVTQTFPLPTSTGGSAGAAAVYPFGTGFVVVGSTGSPASVTVYR
jgi:hypothetical protein